MHPYILLYKTLLPGKYRHYMHLAKGNVDKCHETLLHGTFYEEYDLYGFATLGETERRGYLTDAVRDRICRRVNSRKGERIIQNKWLTHQHLRQYYHRKVWHLTSIETVETILNSGIDIHELVAKPTNLCGGRGVRLLVSNNETECRHTLESLLHHQGKQQTDWIIEQRIVQDERLAQWNPDSVNTIRINTFHRNGTIRHFTSFIRTGRKGSFVDNGAQGGLFASIDDTTGVIFTDGYDEHGQRHPIHPDSHVPFKGQPIPRWDELMKLSVDMAKNLPSMVYIGWDFALTPDGWEPVEANRGEFVAQQMTQGRGLRKEFEKMCGLDKE
jgi:hypothetical protein